jgi:hypothetical protein
MAGNRMKITEGKGVTSVKKSRESECMQVKIAWEIRTIIRRLKINLA